MMDDTYLNMLVNESELVTILAALHTFQSGWGTIQHSFTSEQVKESARKIVEAVLGALSVTDCRILSNEEIDDLIERFKFCKVIKFGLKSP